MVVSLEYTPSIGIDSENSNRRHGSAFIIEATGIKAKFYCLSIILFEVFL